jgi:hypothetical protein
MNNSSVNPPYLKYGLDFRNLFWVIGAILATFVVVIIGNEWILRFVHVLASAVWTGVDLFVGFVIGPILRRLEPETRRSVMLKLTPKTIFLMPMLAIVSPTAGWFLAVQSGYLELSFPEIWWLIVALCITAAMAVQGLFLILTANFRVFRELSKDQPDYDKVAGMTKRFFYNIAAQGVFQITIILIMVRFSVGL